MSFHDLRTYKPIKTNHHMPFELITSLCNQSGKSKYLFYLVFLMDTQTVQIIDVYRGFDILGKFTTL